MTVGEAMRATLLADAEIAALVSVRVYALRLPQPKTGTTNLPAVVLTRISEVREQHLRGVGNVTRSRYQVDSWAQTHDGATALGNLCRARLDGFEGTLTDASGSPPGQLHIQGIFFQNALDLFEPDVHGGICRHSADYFVFHEIL